jgi:hypothetical protein
LRGGEFQLRCWGGDRHSLRISDWHFYGCGNLEHH